MAKAPSRAATFGRAIGVGARLAARSLTEPGGATPAPPAAGRVPSRVGPSAPLAAGQAAGRGSRNLLRGVGAFFGALLRPVARTTHSLWLEITGLFFALFAVFFLGHLLPLRASALHGADHARFLGYSAAALLFLYFSATSFLKARRR